MLPEAVVMAAPGRRERKRAETRTALRWAAIQLALEQGYDGLTVEAITEAADVSPRTFFNYFTSKDDALLGADSDAAEVLAGALAARPPGEPPVAAMRAAFGQLVESFTARQPMWQARLELLEANPQLWPQMCAAFSAFESSLTQALAQRTGRPADTDLYPGVVAAAVVGAMRVAVTHWRSSSTDTSLPELFTAAFDVLATGLSAPTPPSRERS